MPMVVVVGAGFAGCAAAVAAAKAGAEVLVLEKSDMLAGLGVLTGVWAGDGNVTAIEEARALGGAEIFQACESIIIHEIDYIELIKRTQVKLFNVLMLEGAIRKALKLAGVTVQMRARVKDIKMKGDRIAQVVLNDGARIQGDVFVEATGSAGTVSECAKFGSGCVMCVMRCPTFGGRVSLSAKAGVKELVTTRADGKIGAITGGYNLVKNSLAPHLVSELEKKGYVYIPLPKELVKYEKLGAITAQENAMAEMIENFFIFDNGFAKVMVQCYTPLEELHSIPGLENARMADPISGGVGNSVRGFGMSPRHNSMRVEGVANLYCAGEKSGPMSGIPAVVCTGILAGHNAARNAFGKEELVLPRTISIGEFIAYEREAMASEQGLRTRYGFSGGTYFEHMRKVGLYSLDVKAINERVERAGLRDVFAKKQ